MQGRNEMDFPDGSVANTLSPNAGCQGSFLGQATRSHMLQPRLHKPQLKIPHATNKTWCIQINKFFFRKEKKVKIYEKESYKYIFHK